MRVALQIPLQFVQSPAKYLSQQVQVRTTAQAISSNLPAVVTIKKQMGEPVAIAVLVDIIGDAIDFFSVGKTMNDKQLGETARLILQEFYFLKIADLKLFFDRLKTGYYGQLYDRLDGNVIMLYLRNYCDERISAAEEISLQTQQENKATGGEEKYILSTGPCYVAHNPEEGFFEVEQRELATLFTFTQALQIKHWLVTGPLSSSPASVKIKKPHTQIGLIDWMQQHTPHLAPSGETYKRRVAETSARFREIDKDDSLTGYEKHCAKVRLVGLTPMTEKEFEAYCKEVLRAKKSG